jgi:dipeptidyl aminopeptidase/acylaminoacyl peptidase
LYALILVVLGLATLGALGPALIQRAYRAPRVREAGTPGDLCLPYRTAHIPTTHDKRLFAWLVPSSRNADKVPAVVVMHGWGGNAEQMLPFATLLHRDGYAVLLLDARNHGNSDADGHSSMPRFAEDLEHALQWLSCQPGIDPARLVLLGHSVGAGAALLTASRRHDIAAVVSIAAFAHPVELMRTQMRSRRIPYLPVGWLVLRYIERTIGARFDDIAPCNTIRRVTCPVLLVHGEEDARIPSTDAFRIYANRDDDRTELMLLPNAGHESQEAVQTYGGALTAFIRRSLSVDV